MPLAGIQSSLTLGKVDQQRTFLRLDSLESALNDLTEYLKNSSTGYTEKAWHLLSSDLPFDIKIRAILKTVSRPEIAAPLQIEDLNPRLHLDFKNNCCILTHLMAAYEEVALICSPFYSGLRRREDIDLVIFNREAKLYHNLLQEIAVVRKQINEKLEADGLEKVCPTLDSCVITYADNLYSNNFSTTPNRCLTGSPRYIYPPLDFSHWKLSNVCFIGLPFSSAEHFKKAELFDCTFKGEFALVNQDALKQVAKAVNIRLYCDVIEGKKTRIGDPEQAYYFHAEPVPKSLPNPEVTQGYASIIKIKRRPGVSKTKNEFVKKRYGVVMDDSYASTHLDPATSHRDQPTQPHPASLPIPLSSLGSGSDSLVKQRVAQLEKYFSTLKMTS